MGRLLVPRIEGPNGPPRQRRPVFASVSRTTNQLIADSTSTVVVFDQENLDTHGMVDLPTSNDRITVIEEGYYDVGGYVIWPTAAGTQRAMGVWHRRPSGGAGFPYLPVENEGPPTSGTNSTRQPASILVKQLVLPGDYFQLHSYQVSGGVARNLSYGELWIAKRS